MVVQTARRHGQRMLITMDRSGGYEDLLRSLGALLDERGARGVIVRDIPAGLLVRAMMPSQADGVPGGSLAPIDRLFPNPTLLEAQVGALMLRGTAREAGPIERALRIVGRQIDAQGLRDATAVQGTGDGQWSVWHHRIADGRVEVIRLTTEELEGFGMATPVDADPSGQHSPDV